MLVNDRLCHFFYKNWNKTFYGAKLIFRSFAAFFGLTIFTSAKKFFIDWIHLSLKPKCKNLGSGYIEQLADRSQLYYKLP